MAFTDTLPLASAKEPYNSLFKRPLSNSVERLKKDLTTAAVVRTHAVVYALVTTGI